MSMASDPADQGLPSLSPGARTRRDWTARARSSTFDALRYTKFVVRMKRVLSLSAFAVIFAVLAFFVVQRQPRQLSFSYERLGHIENDLAMIKPHLSGADAKGNPFVITAATAIQDAKNPKRATLKTIEADFTAGGQGWFNARARDGLVDMNTGQLELGGGIQVFSDSGYELDTQSASVDLKKSIVHGHNEVTGRGPLGDLRADRFHFDRGTNQLLLEGHVRTTINGKGK